MTIGITGAVLDVDYNYQAPASSDTVTLALTDWHVVINPAGTLSNLTVQMTSAPYDGQVVDVKFTQDITALSVSPGSGQAIGNGAPTSIDAGHSLRAIYRSASTTWYVAWDDAGGSGTPGSPVNSVQFNSTNTFAGSSAFLWSPGLTIGAATGSTALVTPSTGDFHVAIGNYAVLNTPVAYPGDPVNSFTFASSVVLLVNSLIENETESPLVSFQLGFRSTTAITANMRVSDMRGSINSDSTAALGFTNDGCLFDVSNFGTGNVNSLGGADYVVSNGGTGVMGLLQGGAFTVATSQQTTTVRGLYLSVYGYSSAPVTNYVSIFIDSLTGTSTVSAVNAYGIYISDHGGIGATNSDNIRSSGANSRNVFEGIVAGSREPRASYSTDHTVVVNTDIGTQFDNVGATATMTYTLPAATLGLKYGFCCGSSYTMNVVSTSAQIALGVIQSTGGTISSCYIFSYAELEAISTSQWVAKTAVGSWTVT